MTYLLDTNVVSELRKGTRCNKAVREWFASVEDEDLYLSVLVLGEIERGIERIRQRDSKSATRLRRWLTNLSKQFEDRILPITLPIARAWGKMGAPNPIPTVDGLLAATAQAHGLILVTRNTRHIEALDVEHINPF